MKHEQLPEVEELRSLLNQKYHQYNIPGFIEDDPIQIPHQYSGKEDIEIAGFLSALIAWGRRSMIIRNAERLLSMMEGEPYRFLMDFEESDLKPFAQFVHRTFNGQDCQALLRSLQWVYREFGGLESIFAAGIKADDPDVYGGILHARTILLSHPSMPSRTHKHIANPAKGSSAKRINMFLRWMVRKDHAGVDFGLWDSISPSQLICPLDVHTATVARRLGLLFRKQNDWKAALALTQYLRLMDPHDPVKYDFALFGIGVYGDG